MNRWFSPRRVLAFLVVSAALSGLLTLPAAAGTRVQETKYGFSFSLPTKWTPVPLNGGDISGILDQATKSDPSLKGALTKEITKAAKSAIKFFAFGPIHDNFASNINIIVTSSAGYSTGPSYFGVADSQVKIELTQAGFMDLKTSVVQLPMGKELEATYDLPVSLSGVPAQGLQLYIKHKAYIEIITFTSTLRSTNVAAAHVLEDSWQWN
jgi:hypothetical protein